MTERSTMQRQIEELDRKIRELQERIDQRNVLSIRQQVWLAQTVGEKLSDAPESRELEYPTGASATFGIKFRRPKFEEKIGNATQGDLRPALEGEFGSDKPQRYAMTVPRTYIREGAEVFVVEINGQFYFLPDNKSAYIVELDEDLKPASNQKSETVQSSSTGENTDLSCVRASHSSATIWGFNDKGLLCPTEGRLEAPEGIYNFQTDQTISATKSNGDPNLIRVVREADSGRYVPECPTCGTTVPPTSVECNCLSEGGANVCEVFIQIGSIATLDRLGDVMSVRPDDEFSGQTWPDYCTFNVGSDIIHDVIPCSSCFNWNRQGGFQLEPSFDTSTQSECEWGMKEKGCSFNAEGLFGENLCARLPKPFKEQGNYPCTPRGGLGAYGIFAYFRCPETPDTTGTATVDIWIDGCLFLSAIFDDVSYFGGLDTDLITNRVSKVQIFESSRCVCLLDTNRVEKAQGNFNADTGTPNLQNGGLGGFNVACHNYVVSVAGTHDFGDGGVALLVNDLVVYDEVLGEWVTVDNDSGAVDSTIFLTCEIVNLIDSDGCSWSATVREAAIELLFTDCPA